MSVEKQCLLVVVYKHFTVMTMMQLTGLTNSSEITHEVK